MPCLDKPKLPSRDHCCGCSACYAACPHNAIVMLPDEEGFLQPIINSDLCVGCGKCTHACPVLHPGEPRTPLATYAAKAKDDELRRISSSGGIFSLLARKVLEKGGVVYGAAFEPNTHKVLHIAVEDEKDLDRLRGSKYVQSEMGDTYRHVKRNLVRGREVLFSGCPCQIAGLKRFLGEEYANLLLVDVICHAVPSPLAWQKYLSCQESSNNAKVTYVWSRRNCSWRRYTISIEFTDSKGDAILVNPACDTYLRAFGSELFNRKCCHKCVFRHFTSGSDITIGDYWGVERVLPEFSDDIGVSAVCINTEKGNMSFSYIKDCVCGLISDIKDVAKINKTVFGNHKANKKRDRFFAEVKSTDFDELVERLMTPPLWYRILRWIKWHTIGRPKES